jgi:putative ABC transport system permease protein
MGERKRARPFWYLRRKPDAVASEIDDELRVHLEMRVEELTAGGMTAEDARREALRQFGDVEKTRAYCRREDERREDRVQLTLMLQDFAQDARIAIRSLLRTPVVALMIVLTIGLGIGATTAIFCAVNATLLRPLPYADPGRLVRIYTDTPPFVFRFSAADYLALTAQQTQFEKVAAYTGRTLTFSDGQSSDLVPGKMVSWAYFDVLGIQPALGRGFTEADGKEGAPRAVIVSHAFWQQRLGGRPDALGQPVRLDGADYMLAGVLPRKVGPLEHGQEWFAVQQFKTPSRRGPFLFTVIARLRPGATPSAAAAELRAIDKRIFPLWKSSYQDDKATWSMIDLKSHVVHDVSSKVAGLALAAVGLVWLIACANASSLLIARVTGRRHELAVRVALGASRGRIVRYLLAESAVLAAGSVAVGVALARAGVDLLRSVGGSYLPRAQEIALDGTALWVLAGLTLASLALFGLVPALHGAGGPVGDSLRSSGRGSTGSVTVRRLRRVLVGTQFAVTTPLLVVAALLLASLNELKRVDLGFDSRNLVVGSIRLPLAQYQEPGRVIAFWKELERRIAALPGVKGVAFADGNPPNNVSNINNFDLEDLPTEPGKSQPATPWVEVTPEYFGVMGLKLLEGRLLEERDGLKDNLEDVVVDRAWSRRFFPNGGALGKRFHEGGCTSCPWTTVVGIVSNVKYVGLDTPDQGTVYWPKSGPDGSRQIIVRTKTDPSGVIPSIRQRLRELEPGAPLSGVATVDTLVEESLDQPRSLAILVGAFALTGLSLAVFGIYGVMAYFVQQQSKDISIRMALGSTIPGALRLLVGNGMKLVALGVAAGLLASLALTRLTASLLFDVRPADPLVLSCVGALLLFVAVCACLIPAIRGTRVAPAALLRNE